jgi:glycosyltransferase involved in cell wall biosynthesis
MSDTPRHPLVSILIPAYNAERYIKAALDSALMQDYPNFEVVVVDDGSKDKTWEIIQTYTDPRVRAIRQENQGITPARNRLFKEAKGDYIAYLDCDDIYLQGRISEPVAFLESHPEYALTYCEPIYFFDGQPDKLYRHSFKLYSGDEVFPALLEHQFITNTTITFRREVYDKLGGYNPETGIVEDWEYFIRMVRNGYKIALLNEDLVRFRLRWDSNTNFARQVEIKDSQVKIFEQLKAQMTEDERAKWNIDRWLADRKQNYVMALLSNGEKKTAWGVYGEIRARLSFVRRAVVMAMMITPAPVLRFAIEKGWNARKRNLFVQVH